MFHIFDKLGVSSRLELMFKVLSRGRAGAELAYSTVSLARAFISPNSDLDSGSVTSLESWCSAAEQGSPWAQLALGECYRHGLGVTQNKIRAYAWFQLAAKTSDQVGMASDRARQALAKEMTAAEVSEADRLATGWTSSARERIRKTPGNLPRVVA